MPEDTDLMAEDTEKADSAESLNKSKHLMDLSSNSQKLDFSANDMKAKKLSNKTKRHQKQNDLIFNSQISAKNVCNNNTKRNGNGYTKRNNTSNTQTLQTQQNESNVILKDTLNGLEADDTDIEEETDKRDNKVKEEMKDSNANEDKKSSNESSVKGLDQQIEDNKIEEYLQRSDTAVIFAEPVDKVQTNKNCMNETNGQSVEHCFEDKQKPILVCNQNTSSEQSETTAPLNVLHARCPHCGRIFRGQRSSLSLQEHITSIHAVIVPSSKSNMASSPLSSHSSDAMVGRIDMEKTFVCSKCKASFAQKDHLERHELLHSTQGQFCQLCNKSFANVYRLQRHMLSHDQSQVLRKFKCPECFKAFKFKHHLKEHIRIHSGEKPFACPNCAKRFSHSGSYSSHMTSKKCLVVNLKVKKVDQIRNQRNRNNHLNGGNTNGVISQTSLSKFNLLANNSDNPTNLRNNRFFKKEQTFDISSNRNHSVLKKETTDDFTPLFLTPDLSRCVPNGAPFANYMPTNYSSGLPGLHPALFSAAAASVGLPTHYLSTALSTYPEVANAILRSQTTKSVKDIELSSDKRSINYNNINPKLDLMNICDNQNILENYDLNSMKKILQIVDSTVKTKSGLESVNAINNSSYGEMRSSNPSPLTLSASSLPLPQITPIDSPEDMKKSFTNCLRCRYCNQCFESKTHLYQHESHVCKSRISSTIKSSIDNNSNDFYNKSHQNSNVVHSSAAESDSESQRDSSSLEEEVMTTDGKKVRVRSVLGEETLRILRAQYEFNPRPKKHDILRLAEQVNYSPRVVQVWFQNMRARDRRLGKPISSLQLSSDLQSQREMNVFSPNHSIANPLMPISIPHYKPTSNLSMSENMSFSPNITSFSSEINGLPHYGQRLHNNSVYYLNSSEYSLTPVLDSNSKKVFSDRSDSVCPSEEPLDLSLRNKFYVENLSNNNNDIDSEDKCNSIEVLNLSQKSSRSQSNETSDEEIHNNVSLALIQLQQRKELEQTSIVRSMLMNKCCDESDNKFSVLNVVNGTGIESPTTEPLTRCLPPNVEEGKSCRRVSKRSLCGSEDVEHQSDSNNPSDDTSNTSPIRTKHSIDSPTKLWKVANDAISCDDQSPPPDPNAQSDGTGLFTCDQCDKTFSKQSSLARHKYEHSGQRPHKCDVCSKAFKHKHHLTEHKRLHSGEKPFQCKKCLKRFSHSGSYSQHMNHRYSYCKPYRE